MASDHGTVSDVGRPRDADLLRAALRKGHAVTGVEVVFGGLPDGQHDMRLREYIGLRTAGLRDLVVRHGIGLGGRTIATQRPAGVRDYSTASTITHDYDQPVLGEGIRSVAAVPVMVGGRARALMYAAVRSRAPIGGRVIDAMAASARELAHRLHIEDEVDTRMRLISSRPNAEALDAPTREDVREVYRDLRRIAQQIDDVMVRAQLRQASDRLIGSPRSADLQVNPRLTPRELDVLGEVALGCTNAEVATRLSLKTETVKAYLKSASQKLGATSRHQAVSTARRWGYLP